ncbi:MAG: hypothetical protein HYZ53_10940 [Planctomycetes bacterium]|nr:hypothetical protein [Planctomycetota bacterium]
MTLGGAELAAEDAAGWYEPPLEDTRIPWEDRGGRDLRGLVRTSALLLRDATRFYHALPRPGSGFLAPLAFAAAWECVGAFGSVLTRLTLQAADLDPEKVFSRFLAAVGPAAEPAAPGRSGPWPGLGAGGGGGGDGAGPLGGLWALAGHPCVTFPFQVALGIAAIPFLVLAVHAGVWIAGGRRFDATWRVVCYASAVQALSLLPVVGWLLAGLLWVAVVLTGLRFAADLSLGRAVLALALPLFGGALLTCCLVFGAAAGVALFAGAR